MGIFKSKSDQKKVKLASVGYFALVLGICSISEADAFTPIIQLFVVSICDQIRLSAVDIGLDIHHHKVGGSATADHHIW